MARAYGPLTSGQMFDTAYKEGIVINGPLFVVRASRAEGEATRVGYAVGKRMEKSSVGRNRIRRRLRESSRIAAFPSGWRLVVTAKAPARAASFESLVSMFERTATRLRVLSVER